VQGDTTDVTFGSFSPSSPVKKRLEKVLDASGEDADDIEDSVRFLGETLDEQMPASANDGVLFVVNADIDSGRIADGPRNVVVLLKLDTEEDQRIVLDQDSGDINEIDEDTAFPPREQLQKGAVYPKDGVPPTEVSSEIKIYQSSPSDYFEQFLNLSSVLPSSLEQGRDVLNYVTDVVSEELDRNVRSGDVSSLVSKAEENDGTIDAEVVADTLSELTGSKFEPGDVTDDLENGGYGRLSLGADNLPQMIKHTVTGGSSEITVKYHSSDTEHVEVERDEDGVEIYIEGAAENPDWVDR
jgi:hypothetical protein